jgi:hypothetical protein
MATNNIFRETGSVVGEPTAVSILNLTLASKVNLDILKRNTANQKSALSHFRQKVVIEHSNIQATKCQSNITS